MRRPIDILGRRLDRGQGDFLAREADLQMEPAGAISDQLELAELACHRFGQDLSVAQKCHS
jgi:hypothetical protein